MSREGRGWGTTIVASLGLLGAVVAGLVGDLFQVVPELTAQI